MMKYSFPILILASAIFIWLAQKDSVEPKETPPSVPSVNSSFTPSPVQNLTPTIHSSEDQTSIASKPELWDGLSPQETIARLIERGDWEHQKGAFFHQWGSYAPTEALDYIENNPDSSDYTASKAHIFTGWARADFEAATQWLNSQPRNSETAHCLTKLVQDQLKHTSDSTPDLQTLLKTHQDTPGIQIALATYIHSQWRQNLSQTLDWYSQEFPSAPYRQQLSTGIVRMALADGPIASDKLVDWMLELPKNALRDEFFSAYAHSITEYDIEIASEWAEAIQDPSLKSQTQDYLQSYQAPQTDTVSNATP